jgi:hypothetical protein
MANRLSNGFLQSLYEYFGGIRREQHQVPGLLFPDFIWRVLAEVDLHHILALDDII